MSFDPTSQMEWYVAPELPTVRKPQINLSFFNIPLVRDPVEEPVQLLTVMNLKSSPIPNSEQLIDNRSLAFTTK